MNRLKELRQEKGLSQKAIAELLSINEKTIYRWENGESQIKPDKAQALADFFKVSVGYLLGYSEYISTDDFLKTLPEQCFNADVYNAIDSIGEKNLPLFYKFLENEFLEEYGTISEFPSGYSLQESVKIAMRNVTENLWGLPNNIVKLVLYWSVLTPVERANFFNLIKITADKNLSKND